MKGLGINQGLSFFYIEHKKKQHLIIIKRCTTIFFLILFNFYCNCQTQFGSGCNVGIKDFGIEFQTYSLERLKVFVGSNLRKYNAFSTRIGAGLAVRPRSKRHNFWINTSLEHKFANNPTLIRDDVYYFYRVNSLNYWNIEGAYSFRIDKFFDEDKFLLVEAKLISKQLLSKIHVDPFKSNSSFNLSDESRLRQHFYSGFHAAIGIKFVW